MNSRRIAWQMITIILVISMLVVPFSQGKVSAAADRPGVVYPFDGSAQMNPSGQAPTPAFATGGFKAAFPGGGDRLVATQNADGGWGWPLTGTSALNTIGPIAMGLAQAYRHTASVTQKAGLLKAGTLFLTKTNNFSPCDGYLAAQLDQIFGGSAYTTHVKTNFYDPLAAGTYNRSGAGTLYDTTSYINAIRTGRAGSQANMAAWDVGMGLVGAAMAGASTAEWVDGVKAEINELDGTKYYDVIGLAGAVYGLATVGAAFDPTAGQHAAASSVSDLAVILASYQIGNGGFTWNSAYVSAGNETTQETAYAILALHQVNRTAYQGKIQGAAHYLIGVQLPTGGWDNFVGDPDGENNELTGEALWGISMLPAGVWKKYSGNPVVTGSMAFDPVVIKDGSTYKMWYTHVDNSGIWTIYYAVSTDGIAWTNQTQVLAASGIAGAYDEVRVAGPAVVIDGAADYKMWFSARDANAVWTIGYATSSDGIAWTKVGQKLSEGAAGTWDSQMVREPSVINDGGTYKMWYAGSASWPVFKIGYATSPDGITWTKAGTNPVFTGTPGGWDSFEAYAPSVVKDGSTYHLFFSGTDNNMSAKWSTGHATSADGVAWTEDSRNPILIPDGTDDSLDYVSAMNDGGTWKIWYSYGGAYAIGLATLTSDAQLWLDPAIASIQNNNSATQTFTVKIANAVDLYGYQFAITFDPANLEAATAAAFDNSFFSTPLGSPPAWNATIDNVTGKVSFARTRQNPQLPVSGDGALATVTFRSKSGAAAGSYKINFASDILADIDSTALTHTTQYAWLTLFGVGNLQGSVDLQGRTNESGGTVTILNASGYLASTPIVAADGSWSFTGIPAGAYQVNIEMARYLDAQKGDAYLGGVAVSAGGTITLSKVKLLGGDANDDDVVDISDATIIGAMFGLTAPSDVRADINNDNTVDVLDLVLMGGNFNKVSPVPWP